MGRKKLNGATITARFWPKVNKTDGCWLWTASLNKGGYGQLSIGHAMPRVAHRVSWEINVGPIPDGMCVLHKCDVRNCVRPDHLFIGTQLENIEDARLKGRVARGPQKSDTKLKEADVKKIRELIAEGETNVSIAKMFSVERNNIRCIRNGTIWAWVK